MRWSISKLEALAALAGGVDAAAEMLDIDEDVYQSAMDGTLDDYYEPDLDAAARDFEYYDADMHVQLEVADAMFHNLTDRQISAMLHTVIDKGKDFNDALAAFIKDGWNISSRKDSMFWEWYRDNVDSP